MRQRQIELRFPSAGLSRRMGFQNQAPYYAADALNVWPSDTETGRERGGSRPGLRSYATLGGTPRGIRNFNYDPGTGFVSSVIAVVGSTFYRSTGSTFSSLGTGSLAGTGFVSLAPCQQKLFAASGGTINYYDPVAGTVTSTITASAGTVPANCNIVVSWVDRLVVAGNPAEPHVWYMSRLGDFTDWEYGETDQGSAQAGTNYQGGAIGPPITCLIPHNRGCLIIGSLDAMFSLRGNPNSQGSYIEQISHSVGPISQSAWCRTDKDQLIIMTRDGLYAMDSACGSPPVALSREHLPRELINIDTTSYGVHLAYDQMLQAVHIWVTPTASTNGTHWLYDMRFGGYWPIQLGAQSFQPLAVTEYPSASTSLRSAVLLASKDGTVRQFDYDAENDTDTNFTTSVTMGPIKLSASPDQKAALNRYRTVTQGAPDIRIRVADIAEDSMDSIDDPQTGGKFLQHQCDDFAHHHRFMGHAATVSLGKPSTDDGASWSMESVVLQTIDAGRMQHG